MAAVDKLNKLVDLYHENKLSHAYLIETNDIESCFNDLKEIIKKINCKNEFCNECNKCNLCNLLDNGYLPSFITVEADGKNIKKEQIIELKSRFNTIPTYTNENIYIIKEAEKLNSSSANTMLKFLEEPEEHIIGFFITNNLNNVINTIRSRCETLSIKYEKIEEEILNNKYIDTVYEYLKKIELEKNNTIMYNRSVILENYSDKLDILNILKLMLEIYNKVIKERATNLDNDFNTKFSFLYNLEYKKLIKRVKLIAKYIDDLSYNVNIELFLDKFIIELSDNNG